MAKKLDAFPIKSREHKYPWHEWTDGGVWEIKKGEDFECEPHGLGLYQVAKRLGMKVRVHNADENTVVFQFFSEEILTA